MPNPKWCAKHSQYAHDCSDCAALVAPVPPVESVDSAARDTARLDWMQRTLTLNGEFGAVKLYSKGSLTFTCANLGAKGSHSTIREAIDAEMPAALTASIPSDKAEED